MNWYTCLKCGNSGATRCSCYVWLDVPPLPYVQPMVKSEKFGLVKCPVCEGRGQVPKGFYLDSMPTMSAGVPYDKCRRCNGSGTI